METYGIEELGINAPAQVYRNLQVAQLVEHALAKGEGTLSNTGALVVKTGRYTGRAAKDKFIVDTPGVHDDIAWGKVNVATTRETFNALWDRVMEYLNGNHEKAMKIQLDAIPLINALFREVNPIPVKAAMNKLGMHAGPLRMPLTEMTDAGKEVLFAEMKKFGL